MIDWSSYLKSVPHFSIPPFPKAQFVHVMPHSALFFQSCVLLFFYTHRGKTIKLCSVVQWARKGRDLSRKKQREKSLGSMEEQKRKGEESPGTDKCCLGVVISAKLPDQHKWQRSTSTDNWWDVLLALHWGTLKDFSHHNSG